MISSNVFLEGVRCGFPHRPVRDETQRKTTLRQSDGQQKKYYFNCKIENHTSMDISVVVPLYNEEESSPNCCMDWAGDECQRFFIQVIFMNDKEVPTSSWQVIEQLQAQAPDKVRGIKFRRNYGKSPALFCGFEQTPRRRRDNHERHFPGTARRNTRTLPQLPKTAMTSYRAGSLNVTTRSDPPHQIVQCHRPQSIGHQNPARL